MPLGEGIGRFLEACVPDRQNQLEGCGTHGERAFLVNKHGKRLSGESLGVLVRRLARDVECNEKLRPVRQR